MCTFDLCVETLEVQKMLDLLELELKTVVSHLVRVLGTKLGPCGRAACALEAQKSYFLNIGTIGSLMYNHTQIYCYLIFIVRKYIEI